MSGLSRRAFLQASGAVALSGLAPSLARAQSATPRPPNVVVILADDLGYGELGCYGQKLIQTPRLDAMAAEGVRCTDYYAGNAICAPSRCSLLTGRHSGHATIRDNSINRVPAVPQESLGPDDVTFAQILHDAGYATGLFGKWGFGPDSRAMGEPQVEYDAHPSWPLQRGFDEFVGFVHHHQSTQGYYATYVWEGNKRVDLPQNANDARATYLPDLYVGRALDFIRRNADRPFLLELAMQLPHTPNHCPTTDPYSDQPWPETTKKHAAMITRLDMYVGQVLDTLRSLGLAEDTIVLFTSDNGPHDETTVYGGDVRSDVATPGVGSAADNEIFNSSGGLRGGKHNMYEGGIRVPMIAWAPGRLKPRTVEVPWAGYDVQATLAELAGTQPAANSDGISAWPLLNGAPGARRHGHLYWERPDYAVSGGVTPVVADRGQEYGYVQAAREGRYKAVRFSYEKNDPYADGAPFARTELYDLAADRAETTNIAGNHPEVVAHLEALMRADYVPRK
jgi:arylsulfatase A